MVKRKVPTVEKKDLILVLPLLRAVSLQIRTKLMKALKGVFILENGLSSVFVLMVKYPKNLLLALRTNFSVVYQQ